ncbi:MAG: hypothetical protein PHN82_06400 [bacterium]|nr:hypothetical protein [bacterium]
MRHEAIVSKGIDMSEIVIDPREFIMPPYIDCPKCGKQFFGVLMICPDKYFRRCKNCFYPRPNESGISYPLPTLKKKVIYIDQFAISNMMLALNPASKAFRKGNVDLFWSILFEKLDRLCKLQLIVCPDSSYHANESLVSPFYAALKRMYEQLSYGVSFYASTEIKLLQIHEHCTHWASGDAGKSLDLDVTRVVSGEIHAWQEKMYFSVNMSYSEEDADEVRKARERIHVGLARVFHRWQSEKDRTFDDWFNEEASAFGQVTLQIFRDAVIRRARIQAGQIEMTRNDLYPPYEASVIFTIQDVLKEHGVQPSEIWPKTIEYLTSLYLRDIPFVKISSMLVAAIARKAASGMRKPPNQGMNNDIGVISVLLPYCDAMFIDNQCCSLLKERPLCERIAYNTDIFCQNAKDDFISYLDRIEKSASLGHFTKVKEVYGDNWPKPYHALYEGTKDQTNKKGGTYVD